MNWRITHDAPDPVPCRGAFVHRVEDPWRDADAIPLRSAAGYSVQASFPVLAATARWIEASGSLPLPSPGESGCNAAPSW